MVFLKYSTDATTTTYYPNKHYNTNGTKETKHIFANGSMVATIETESSTTTIQGETADALGNILQLTQSVISNVSNFVQQQKDGNNNEDNKE